MTFEAPSGIEPAGYDVELAKKRLRIVSVISWFVAIIPSFWLGLRWLLPAAIGVVAFMIVLAARLDIAKRRLCLAQLDGGEPEAVDRRVIRQIRARSKSSSGSILRRFGPVVALLALAFAAVLGISYMMFDAGDTVAVHGTVFLVGIAVLLPAFVAIDQRRSLSADEKEILRRTATIDDTER